MRYPEPYSGIHHWLYRHKERTGACERCGAEGRTDFANISGEYRREIEDYIELCCTCHRHMDRGEPLSVEEKRQRTWARIKAWREANPEKYRAQQERKNAARRKGDSHLPVSS